MRPRLRPTSAVALGSLLIMSQPAVAQPEPALPSPTLPQRSDVTANGAVDADGWRITFDDDSATAIVFPIVDPGQKARWRYMASADGVTFTDPVDCPTSLPLRVRAFDPLVSIPDFDQSGVPSGGNLFLVQYWTRPLQPYSVAVAAAGGRLVRYLGASTYVASIEANPNTVAALPFVRAVTPYHPLLRMEPELTAGLDGRTANDPLYSIHVAERGPDAKHRVADVVLAVGGQIVQLYDEGFNLIIRVSSASLPLIAAQDDVLWIERTSLEPIAHMDKVRVDGGADELENDIGFTGQGVRGEVLDLGVNANHSDFQSPKIVIHKTAGNNPNHGTSTHGIVFGNGTGSANARGLLPDGQGIFCAVSALGNRYTHTAELLGAPYNAVFQSNSWGFQVGTNYTNLSAELDDICFINEDFVILHAMGNFGSTVSDAFAWSKNVVSVGGIQHLNTQNTNDDKWQNAGSIGPASDGRIKPDLSYWFDSIRTTAPNGYTNSFGGTSAATPETAGHFGLMMQMWHEERLGNASDGATVFASRPKASTARALMINGASAYTFSGAGADLSRFHQGWGRADVGRLHDQSDSLFVVNEEVVLSNLGSASFTAVVPATSDELRVTMAYKDPQGTPSSSVLLVNDLTLRVTSPSGVMYYGNVGLKGGNASTPGGMPNHRDPIENVWVSNPEAGTWTFDVLAESIVQDQHTETPAIDADFALVVSGVEPTFMDLGQGLAGATGTPKLTGRGYLVEGTRFEIELSSAAANTQGVLILGTQDAATPLLGGTLVPSPQIILPIVTNNSGGFEVSGAVPARIMSGTVAYMQTWIADASGPFGATASNALRIRTP